jgi:hypothetical protein
VNGDAAICLTHRIGSKVGYRTIGRCLVFLCSTLPKGTACVFGPVRSHDGDDVTPVGIKECDAYRVLAVPPDLGAIALLLLPEASIQVPTSCRFNDKAMT